jgi:hypothetical protein
MSVRETARLAGYIRRSRHLCVLAVAFAMLASALVVSAPDAGAQSHTIHVSPSGNDNNPGTRARPKYSLVSAMLALPNGGDVVMRGGSYRYDSSQSGLWRGGTRARPLVIESAKGERARITSAPGAHCVLALGDYTQVRRIDCTGYRGIQGYNASHIKIIKNRVHDLSADRTQGIIVDSGSGVNISHVVIRKNTVTRVPHSGIAVGAQRQNSARNVVVEKNKVREANYQMRHRSPREGGWGSGISVLGSNGVKILKNDVRRTYGEGINCPLSNNCRVRRNTVVDAWNVMYYADNTSNSVWEDNVAKWTGDRTFTRDYGGGAFPAAAFSFGNEIGWYNGPGISTRNNTVRNNVAIGTYSGVGFIVESSAGFRDILVANNTFVDVQCGFDLRRNGGNSGIQIYNNIVDTKSRGHGNCSGTFGSRFRNNLWVDRNGGDAAHSSDRNGSARFVGGSRFSPSSYKLTGRSRAVDAGIRLGQVWDDRSSARRPQGTSHDIGAYEH